MAKETKEPQEQTPVNEPKKRVIESGAEFFKFSDENPVFTGTFVKDVIREQDGENEHEKAGSIMGYHFVDENGESFIIGASHTIQKVLETEENGVKIKDKGLPIEIHFKGQITNKKGRKVNMFEISLWE